jgi:enoyl-CoA hydratase/carnithine racemase
MDHAKVSTSGDIATITLSRGKVNAINERVVEQLYDRFKDLESQPEIHSIILTGKGKFFS